MRLLIFGMCENMLKIHWVHMENMLNTYCTVNGNYMENMMENVWETVRNMYET